MKESIQAKQILIGEEKQKLGLLELFRYATRTEKMLNVIALLSAMSAGVILPATTILFGELIDSFAKWTGQQFIGQLITADELSTVVAERALYFVYLALFSYATNYISISIFVYTAHLNTFRIRNEYLKSVLRQNIAWFDDVGAGEIATRITSNTLLIQDGIGEKIPIALSLLFTFIAGFAIAFYRSWKLTLVLIAVIPFLVGSAAFIYTLNSRFQTRIQGLYSKSGSTAEECISAIRTIASFNGQMKMNENYASALDGLKKEGIKQSIASGIGAGAMFMFVYFAYALAFWYGGILLENNEITPGVVVNVFFAVLIGAFSLGQIAPDMQAISFALGAGAKIFQTIDHVPEIDTLNPNGLVLNLESVQGNIEFKNVSFKYPSRQEVPVLQSISFNAAPGSTIALVGQSGSGKSTIVSLLERFYDCTAGEILIDGINIKDLNLHSLRSVIGLVQQEPVLFEGTIAENVAMGLAGTKHENNISDDELMKKVQYSCEQANAHMFISNLPNGYNTSVGERGMLLSGGQKQRIAIARAIIKEPPILLLDEATSALDVKLN